ncbi:MAG: sulfur carrier protein ThiS [Phycisphaerales bacterium]|nr:sulfur carrier protein ThiS [Phycisphaerales bacterium]
MRITLNGQLEALDSAATVADLLARLKLEPIRVAVEVNEDLVPRKSFEKTPLRDGDRVEIVTFVGGG